MSAMPSFSDTVGHRGLLDRYADLRPAPPPLPSVCWHRSRRPPADPGEPDSYSSSTYIILRASSAATPHALAPLPSPLRMFPSHHPPCPHPHYTPTPSLLLPSHALALYPLASCPPPTPYSRHFQMSGADGVDDGGSLDDSEAEKQNANKAVKGASGTCSRSSAGKEGVAVGHVQSLLNVCGAWVLAAGRRTRQVSCMIFCSAAPVHPWGARRMRRV